MFWPNYRETVEIFLDIVNFKDMGCKLSCACSFRYCIPVSMFKAIGQLLTGFGILQIVDTVSFGGDCSCFSAVEHSIAKKLRVRGVHVHAVWFTRLRRDMVTPKTIISHNTVFGDYY